MLHLLLIFILVISIASLFDNKSLWWKKNNIKRNRYLPPNLQREFSLSRRQEYVTIKNKLYFTAALLGVTAFTVAYMKLFGIYLFKPLSLSIAIILSLRAMYLIYIGNDQGYIFYLKNNPITSIHVNSSHYEKTLQRIESEGKLDRVVKLGLFKRFVNKEVVSIFKKY